ncbi:MAG: glycosyltransferase family 9 protein [Nitrospinaceae bacterium]
MTQKPESNLTAIVAVEDSAGKLRSCLKALNRWIPDILVVHPLPDEEIENTARALGAATVQHPSLETTALWEAGIRQAETSWFLLIRSNEIVTGQLRKSIMEKTGNPCESPTSFLLPRTMVFLQKRLKYPLEWTGLHSSRLVFAPSGSIPAGLQEMREARHPFEGELIHYGKETIPEALGHAMELSELFADRLFLENSQLTQAALIKKGLCAALEILGKKYFLHNRFKEGFEGAAFTLVDLAAHLAGCLRYHEKYLRSGRKLADQPESVRSILLIKLRDIGDNILATPLARNLKQQFPQASITVLTYAPSLPVWENNPNVDQLQGIAKSPNTGEINSVIQRLNSHPFDLAVSVHSGRLATELISKINARHKINSFYRGRDKNYDILTPESDYYRSSIERDLDALRSLGAEPVDTRTELVLKEEEILWAKEQLQNSGFDMDKKIVVVHPTAAAEIREWGMDLFGQLIGKLAGQRGIQTLAICTESEYPRVKALHKYVPDLVVMHRMTLRQMMAIIHESGLVIDNDSSPSHVAAAFNIPAIVLFSQAIKEIFRPYNEEKDKHFVFYKDVDCRECGLDQCDNRICMDFTVDEVLEKCLQLLSGSS